MHYIQSTILNSLAINGSSRFSEFAVLDLTSDHLNFHLKQLLRDGLIQKTEFGYELSAKGLELAGRMNKNTAREIPMPKVSISLGIMREQNGEIQFLLSERLVDQSKGKIAWHTTKLIMGEKLEEAARRCLLHETGLRGDFKYQGLNHVIRTEGDTYEIDVMVLCFRVTNLKGELKEQTEQVRNFWVSYDEALNLENTLVGFKTDLAAFIEDKPIFGEYIN